MMGLLLTSLFDGTSRETATTTAIVLILPLCAGGFTLPSVPTRYAAMLTNVVVMIYLGLAQVFAKPLGDPGQVGPNVAQSFKAALYLFPVSLLVAGAILVPLAIIVRRSSSQDDRGKSSNHG